MEWKLDLKQSPNSEGSPEQQKRREFLHWFVLLPTAYIAGGLPKFANGGPMNFAFWKNNNLGGEVRGTQIYAQALIYDSSVPILFSEFRGSQIFAQALIYDNTIPGLFSEFRGSQIFAQALVSQ
jgi:hypothetical protein